MGRGNSCPNAPELSYMKWATPVTGGSALNASLLPVGQAVTFNLPATYLTGTGNFLRVSAAGSMGGPAAVQHACVQSKRFRGR